MSNLHQHGARWTPEEDDLLTTSTERWAVLAARLGRTDDAVRNRLTHLRRHGVELARRRRRWTAEEDRILADLPFSELQRIATELGRTYWATEWRWSHLRRRQRRAA